MTRCILVFTSGSTGKPKGRWALIARWRPGWIGNCGIIHPEPEDIRLAQASITFLEGGMETARRLGRGRHHDPRRRRRAPRNPEALGALMQRHSVAQVTAVPSLVSALVDSSACRGACTVPAGLRRRAGEHVAAPAADDGCADAADADDAGDGPELLNNIGSTETSGAVSRGRLSLPIPLVGKPLPGADAYLLDDGLRPVPVGVVGELYYAGDQLARGYWKRPGLTASRFVANPFATEPGTGCIAVATWPGGPRTANWSSSDVPTIRCKVRGFRVELAEVEAALAAADGVGAAAARTWEVQGGTSLAGYVVPQQPIADEAQKAAFAASVRAAVAATLPGYMVPSSLTVLDALPKTESGKLNRPGLPRPAVSTSGQTEPPRTDTERALATVFAELLSTAEVGRFDDFFTLGGDSILSVQLAARARAAGLAINPRMVFENPTVQQLAAALDALGADDAI